MSTTDPETPATPDTPASGGKPGTPPEESGKAYLIGETKTLLLEQHLDPATGSSKDRYGQGVREGTVLAYLDVILHLDGDPVYDTDVDTLRKMLLGQALTEHVSG